MYFEHKNVETRPHCLHEFSSYLKCHMTLNIIKQCAIFVIFITFLAYRIPNFKRFQQNFANLRRFIQYLKSLLNLKMTVLYFYC